MNNKAIAVTNYLDKLFPHARCELFYTKDYELLIAVVLSAQTTDKAVNNVTKILFNKYQNLFDLAQADIKDIEKIIQPIGLAKNKAKHIKEIANDLISKYDGKVPCNKNELIQLSGVGNKTACVTLIELFDKEEFPVDTHVSRVSKRLGFANENDDPLKVEIKLKKIFPKTSWKKLHHQFIFFGRYHCKALNPNCENCEISAFCKKN